MVGHWKSHSGAACKEFIFEVEGMQKCVNIRLVRLDRGQKWGRELCSTLQLTLMGRDDSPQEFAEILIAHSFSCNPRKGKTQDGDQCPSLSELPVQRSSLVNLPSNEPGSCLRWLWFWCWGCPQDLCVLIEWLSYWALPQSLPPFLFGSSV